MWGGGGGKGGGELKGGLREGGLIEDLPVYGCVCDDSMLLYCARKRLFFPKLCVHIKDNNNSPHGKFHRFLFLFSSKFPDLNFAPYVFYIYSCYETHT